MLKLVAIIGYPIGHSVSPAMHNAAFQSLDLGFEYQAIEVKPIDLAKKLKEFRSQNFAGFNITVPHKESVLPLLDEVTELAKIIGAVNTVVVQNGKLVGYNTDGAGFIDSLIEDAGTAPKGKSVVVLGAGGASRAISIMLAESQAKSIAITDLQEDKALALTGYVDSCFATPCAYVKMNSQELQQAIDKADILVNTTPVGMKPKVMASPLSKKIKLPSTLLVYDLVYNPSETQLMKQAKTAGAKTCSGLGMLVRQGASAFTLWTGEKAPVELMRQAAEAAL
ncbi:shikimate dehydrogenase [candidate division WOR-1 bacterium RIFCSPLOWO2_02_FULL_46_20]|uniref:Shikimate dehydrogenase (NADP(+)) n=1 Tax=candidate division WOR-1 bacterium RIFCSPLOWO2_02_FULL_46_20 TaxID=1802567 RepID=A0A1F4RBH8_UNCSA|nr:MAG: shikimate dehydrogenase [candidate division WOR-1 bacterium RIFCSPHIGHO2_02_FULL_45_12]OGC05529.1 MAG: shikimate dehydrogenase [candidate division WOR-1 bacterium RIFCSPLOWO2_02_FULL_46_20]